MKDADQQLARKGRATALVVAGTGVFWIVVTLIGDQMGWPTRTRAFFDLAALAGFIWAFVLIYQLWRLRREHQG